MTENTFRLKFFLKKIYPFNFQDRQRVHLTFFLSGENHSPDTLYMILENFEIRVSYDF